MPPALHASLQLLTWQPAAKVKVLGPGADVFKLLLIEGEGWEVPRAPFEVSLALEARASGECGREGQGELYYSSSGSRGGSGGGAGVAKGNGSGGDSDAFNGSGSGSTGDLPVSWGGEDCGGGPGTITCLLGSGALPAGVEAGVCGMLRGERSVVWCAGSAARGGGALVDAPAGLDWVEYTIRLLDFKQVGGLSCA